MSFINWYWKLVCKILNNSLFLASNYVFICIKILKAYKQTWTKYLLWFVVNNISIISIFSIETPSRLTVWLHLHTSLLSQPCGVDYLLVALELKIYTFSSLSTHLRILSYQILEHTWKGVKHLIKNNHNLFSPSDFICVQGNILNALGVSMCPKFQAKD